MSASLPIPLRATASGVVFRVRVVPRASRSEAAGFQEDALKLRIAAPPVEGKANAECIRLLAELFGVKKAQVAITAGGSSKAKTVAIAGLGPEKAAAILGRIAVAKGTREAAASGNLFEEPAGKP